jgi:hypothetical protein
MNKNKIVMFIVYFTFGYSITGLLKGNLSWLVVFIPALIVVILDFRKILKNNSKIEKL